MKTTFEVNTKRVASLEGTPAEIIRAYHQSLFHHREWLDDDAYQAEKHFLSYVKQGDVEGLHQLANRISTNFMVPQYSKNKLRQAQYMMCVTVTLLTRAAIEGGMLPSAALRLSDVYMCQIDHFHSVDDMAPLVMVAAIDFAAHVRETNQMRTDSLLVARCRAYVFDHLHDAIRLEDLAMHCGVSPHYLSARFRKETGHTMMGYIRSEKLKTAKRMLEVSPYKIQDIAHFLGFPSHSSFGEVFRNAYGMTPKAYRNQYLTETSQLKNCGKP